MQKVFLKQNLDSKYQKFVKPRKNNFSNVPGLRPGKPRFCLRPSAASKILALT
jgi:hypothetical protein